MAIDNRQHKPTVEAVAVRLLNALDALDDGCQTPGFRGWENGNGEPVGDEVQDAREYLAALVRPNDGGQQTPACGRSAAP